MSGWQTMSGRCRVPYRFVRHSGAQRGMRSFTVVAGHPLCQGLSEMPLVERNHPIETLAPGRPNEAFAMRVRLRCSHRCFQYLERH